jgi:hypothetical protein
VKIGRNELCACGSKRKYKLCCLSKDETLHSDAGVLSEARGENVMGGKATIFRHAIDRVRAYGKERP